MMRRTKTCLLVLCVLAMLPVAAYSHSITNIVATPTSPASLSFNQPINFTFDYETDAPEGVRIYVRPLAWVDGNPSFVSHGAPLLPVGTGSGSGFFSVEAGAATVTQVRVTMNDADVTTVLTEVIIDVSYTFGDVRNDPLTFGHMKALYR